jgi:NAD(P)-dependent dehydrogenase (short-subunit alcohol dehydrogenase family)
MLAFCGSCCFPHVLIELFGSLVMNRVKDKVSIVTGGALGIGRATCVLLAKEGAKVAVTDIIDDKGKAFVEEIKNLHPIGHMGEPDDIAYGILYLAADESKFVTGAELVIDGGYTAR